MEAHVRSETDDNASNGVILILLSIICFVIAGYAFFAAFIAVQIWLAATILLRLTEGRYVWAAALWSCVLALLVLF
jgi:hypothetical protein